MEKDQLRQFILDSSWFAGAPTEVLDKLVGAASLKPYSANSFIWTTGEITTDIYGVMSGRLRISLAGEMGQEVALIDWEQGAWLGEQALGVEGEPNRLEVRVLVPSELLVIPRRVVLEVGEEWPALYRNLFLSDWTNIRGLYEIFRGVFLYTFKAPVSQRVFLQLDEHGHRVEDGALIDIKLSQNDFARLASGSRQRVNRIFRDWDKQGLVETRGEHLLIRDIPGLQAEVVPFE
jgi:CRP/FNR family cyclic AMP-dependent transcriptional regulator